MEYYSAIKKNEILPFATMWMELEGIMLSKISQSEKNKNHDFTHMRTLRDKTDEHKGNKNNIKRGRGTKQKRLINTERGAWVAHSVKYPTSAQVMISRSVSSSPASGSVLTTQSLEPVSDSVSPSLSPSLCPSPTHTVYSFSQKLINV